MKFNILFIVLAVCISLSIGCGKRGAANYKPGGTITHNYVSRSFSSEHPGGAHFANGNASTISCQMKLT